MLSNHPNNFPNFVLSCPIGNMPLNPHSDVYKAFVKYAWLNILIWALTLYVFASSFVSCPHLIIFPPFFCCCMVLDFIVATSSSPKCGTNVHSWPICISIVPWLCLLWRYIATSPSLYYTSSPPWMPPRRWITPRIFGLEDRIVNIAPCQGCGSHLCFVYVSPFQREVYTHS